MIIRVAITGGIGSGKSLVSSFLEKQGYPVFSCDKIYKELLRDKNYVQQVADLFPEAVEGDAILIPRLSHIVFNDAKKREQLNALAHPLIMSALRDKMSEKHGLVFAEVPLLFEGEYQKEFDEIIVVLRDKSKRIAAIMQRDKVSAQTASKKIEAQFDYDNASSLQTFTGMYVIDNNKEEETLFIQLQKIIESLKAKL